MSVPAELGEVVQLLVNVGDDVKEDMIVAEIETCKGICVCVTVYVCVRVCAHIWCVCVCMCCGVWAYVRALWVNMGIVSIYTCVCT